jgi:hypothetical protein
VKKRGFGERDRALFWPLQTGLESVGAGSPTAPITIQNLDKPAPTFSLQTRFRLSAIRFSFGRRSPHERDRASLLS